MVSLQKNTSKSVEELTRALVTLTDASKGEILTSELKDWIYMLKVHRLRHCSDAHEFCSNGGVEALLKLLCRCSVNRESRDLVLLLGALGNVCALDKNCRTVVSVLCHCKQSYLEEFACSYEPLPFSLCTC